MSLYADEDLLPSSSSYPSSSYAAGPSLSSSTLPSSSDSSLPTDPLQALASALTLPAESVEQASALLLAGQRFEAQPEKLPDLCGQLLPMVVEGGDSLLRMWTLDMVALAVGRSALRVEVKLNVAQSSMDALERLLSTDEPNTLKKVIPIFSTIHPILFRLLATSRPPQQIFDLFHRSKARILAIVLDPNARSNSKGVKAAAWKFVQKVLLAGTRTAGGGDPRLSAKSAQDPNVGLVQLAAGSPLDVQDLEREADLLKTQLVTTMYSSDDPAILHPIFHTIPLLCKSRPTLAALLVSALAAWHPGFLVENRRTAMQVRSVEKTVRMVMMHLLKHPALAPFSVQLNQALARQKTRMDAAFLTEREERRLRQSRVDPSASGDDAGAPISAGAVKTEFYAESSAAASQRAASGAQVKGEPSEGLRVGSGEGKGPELDASTLPLDVVVGAVMEAMGRVSGEDLSRAIQNAKKAIREEQPDAPYALEVTLGVERGVLDDDDDEILNPLDMDMDDEDLLQTHENMDDNLDSTVTLTNFALPPPAPLDATERSAILSSTIERIWAQGQEMSDLAPAEATKGANFGQDGLHLAVGKGEMWMLLAARLATRGMGGSAQDGATGRREDRKGLVDFVVQDFMRRSKFASVWLNEEWFSSRLTPPSSPEENAYLVSLEAILSAYLPHITGNDKALASFLTKLPELPSSVITTLQTLCLDAEKAIVGFLALRDLIETRPPVRPLALSNLLQLSTHPDRKTRVMAISTVRRWVPESPMASEIIAYARGVLRRLVEPKPEPEKQEAPIPEEGGAEVEMEEGEQAEEPVAPVSSPYLPESLVDVQPDQVQQHVELLFALSRRSLDLLDDIFRTYPAIPAPLQGTYEQLATPLIQSLGANAKLIEVTRNCPPGSEAMALKVVQTLSGEGGGEKVRDLVRGLMEKKGDDLDARFVLPILGSLDKAEIEAQIPRIVSLLSMPDSRDQVRTAFASMLQKMTPADLLVALHKEEGGLKATIEAIGICFSMTTVFRSDILATALSRIADLPTLPLVFLRTTIQAVSTYKSLIPFVANGVLPKLVGKKIWENAQLWDGFALLVKKIAPASFGVLLQLPKEWLRDVVDRQPGLKAGLKGFLSGKPQARGALIEIFGDDA